MKKILALVLVLALAIVLAGCTIPTGPVQTGPVQTGPIQQQTCLQQNGFSCTSSQTCNGNLLTATDSSKCCSVACAIPLQTCSPQGGSVCPATQSCDGNFAQASDVNNCCTTGCIVANNLANYNWADKVEPQIRLGSSIVQYYYANLKSPGMALDDVYFLFNNDSKLPQSLRNYSVKFTLLDSNNNVVSDYNGNGKYLYQGCVLSGFDLYGTSLCEVGIDGGIKTTVPGDYLLKATFYDYTTNVTINSIEKKISFGYSVPLALEATKTKVTFVEKPQATLRNGSKVSVSSISDNSTNFKVGYQFTTTENTSYPMRAMLVNDINGVLSGEMDQIYSTYPNSSFYIDKLFYDSRVQNWLIIYFYDSGSNIPVDYIAVKVNSLQ
ncbi:MAG: hypothetical protein AABW59_00475 [archaeon]